MILKQNTFLCGGVMESSELAIRWDEQDDLRLTDGGKKAQTSTHSLGRDNNPLVLSGADRQRFLGEETPGVRFHQHLRRFHCDQPLPLVGRRTQEGKQRRRSVRERERKKRKSLF